jgi:hypothetical protein
MFKETITMQVGKKMIQVEIGSQSQQGFEDANKLITLAYYFLGTKAS